MNSNYPGPGPDLYLKVRGAFVSRGTTLTAWCRKNGHNPTNARSALVGAWNGPKAQALRAALVEESGLEPGSGNHG